MTDREKYIVVNNAFVRLSLQNKIIRIVSDAFSSPEALKEAKEMIDELILKERDKIVVNFPISS